VKDQSHKDEMSAALRGDFQRLRDRGVAATLAPRDEEPQPVQVPHETGEAPPGLPSPAEVKPVADEPPSPEAAGEEPPGEGRTGFLARLLGR
jgi:hypothetical protein